MRDQGMAEKPVVGNDASATANKNHRRSREASEGME
jgi:hypothetical protein